MTLVTSSYPTFQVAWPLAEHMCTAHHIEVILPTVRKVLADQEVPGKNIGSNKCTGTSVCRKSEVQILVPVHELSPDFC